MLYYVFIYTWNYKSSFRSSARIIYNCILQELLYLYSMKPQNARRCKNGFIAFILITLYVLPMSMHLQALLLLLAATILPDIWISYRLHKLHKSFALHAIYWLPTLLFLLSFILLRTNGEDIHNPAFSLKVFWLFGVYALIYVPKLIFTFFSLLISLVQVITKKKTLALSKAGGIIGIGLFIVLLWGMFHTRKDLTIKEVELTFSDLPTAFNGMRVIQFSDAHVGNWGADHSVMERMVQMINEQKPDIICFTGDMVNNFHEELLPYVEILQQLHARYGKFAILGNHDYGDYTEWESAEAREQNLNRTKQLIRDSGFRLLLNEHEYIRHDNDSICIAGVENWGKPPFPQYGNLSQTLQGVSDNTFCILLSHDVSHWKAEVTGQTNIALTLSGHTHAAQLGIDCGKVHISPASWVYDEWDGLYKQGKQYLYVNRGIGFIGMPIRIGMPPEITIITLKKAS